MRALGALTVIALLVGGVSGAAYAQSTPGLKQTLISGSPWEVSFYTSKKR